MNEVALSRTRSMETGAPGRLWEQQAVDQAPDEACLGRGDYGGWRHGELCGLWGRAPPPRRKRLCPGHLVSLQARGHVNGGESHLA